jgi:uncharacterized protein (TIGR03086 family)
METDLIALYRTTSEWTGQKLAGVDDLGATTPCDEWTARDVVNHIVQTQRYFVSAAKGEDASPPTPTPPDLVSDDAAADLRDVQAQVIEAFSPDGVIERTGPLFGIAFVDQLVHGWDLATATGQDSSMPDGLAQAAYELIHGKFSDDQRGGRFKPPVPVADDATPQQRLLAYTGRQPD